MDSNIVKGGNKNSIDIPTDFKSTLPPRKRAKTKEEKEQRRIERILRNRRAAHQSREKKRLRLKFLEDKCNLMQKILNKIDLNDLFKDQPKNLTLINDLTTLEMERINFDDISSNRSKSVSPQPFVKIEENNNDNTSFDFNFTLSEKSNGVFESIPQIPSPSTSTSTMSPLNSTYNNNKKNVELEQEQDFTLLNSENIKTMFNTHSSNDELDFEFDSSLDESNNNDNNLLLTQDNELIVDDDLIPNPSNNIAGSFDLDNWRNPAVVTLLS